MFTYTMGGGCGCSECEVPEGRYGGSTDFLEGSAQSLTVEDVVPNFGIDRKFIGMGLMLLVVYWIYKNRRKLKRYAKLG